MEEVFQRFEKWYASFSSDANVLTKKGFAANAFEAGWKSAQQKMHQTAAGVGILCLFIGYVAGWLIFAFNFGGW